MVMLLDEDAWEYRNGLTIELDRLENLLYSSPKSPIGFCDPESVEKTDQYLKRIEALEDELTIVDEPLFNDKVQQVLALVLSNYEDAGPTYGGQCSTRIIGQMIYSVFPNMTNLAYPNEADNMMTIKERVFGALTPLLLDSGMCLLQFGKKSYMIKQEHLDSLPEIVRKK